MTAAKLQIQCPRCDGTGHYSYNSIYGTVCFQCNGRKSITVDAAKYYRQLLRQSKRQEKLEADRKREDARIIKEQNALEAELKARYTDDPIMQRKLAQVAPQYHLQHLIERRNFDATMAKRRIEGKSTWEYK